MNWTEIVLGGLTLLGGCAWFVNFRKDKQEAKGIRADNRQKDMNRRTSERRGRAGSDYPERELTTSREESGARSDYPEARRKKTIVKEENRRLTSMQCKPCNGK